LKIENTMPMNALTAITTTPLLDLRHVTPSSIMSGAPLASPASVGSLTSAAGHDSPPSAEPPSPADRTHALARELAHDLASEFAQEDSPIIALPPPERETPHEEEEGAWTVMTLIDRLDGAEARIVELERERHQLRAQLAAIDENPLILALQHLDRGTVLAEAGRATARLFALCQATHGEGRLALTLDVAPSAGRNRALVYAAHLELTEPREEATTGFLFVTPDGRLTRDNWGERELPLTPTGTALHPGEAPAGPEEIPGLTPFSAPEPPHPLDRVNGALRPHPRPVEAAPTPATLETVDHIESSESREAIFI
jgi:hypothetical protein